MIYCGIFNSSVILLDNSWKSLSFSTQLLYFSKEYALSAIPCIALFIGLSCAELLFMVGSCLLFLLTAGVSYYLFLFKISPDFDTVKIAFEPTGQAAIELISIPFVGWCLFCVILCIVLLTLIKVPSHIAHSVRISTFAVLICFMWWLTHLTGSSMSGMKQYLQVSYLHSAYDYFKTHILNSDLYDRTDELGEITLAADEGDIIAVLILGESARGDHFSLGGYNRETNPKLSKIDNLFFFLRVHVPIILLGQ